MTRAEIIQQLNECDARPMGFPHMNAFYPIDVRLSAYRDNTDWALVIETLVFNDAGVEGHSACQVMLFCYGSDIPQPPGITYPTLHVTGDGPSGPLFDLQDITQLMITPSAADMTIRGKTVAVTTDPAKYSEAGIQLQQPPRILGFELLRLIAPVQRRMFFATEAEIGDRIGGDMPLLLRLTEWRHPDTDKGESPAQSESFQMIAEAIAANDPMLYRPTARPNTHWRNWPKAGGW